MIGVTATGQVGLRLLTHSHQPPSPQLNSVPSKHLSFRTAPLGLSPSPVPWLSTYLSYIHAPPTLLLPLFHHSSLPAAAIPLLARVRLPPSIHRSRRRLRGARGAARWPASRPRARACQIWGQRRTAMQGVAAADSPGGGAEVAPRPSRYESQKRRDWHTFGQYLRNHRPPLELARCSGAHVLEFLRYLDQFGKTKVHAAGCPFFGHPSPPAPCPCPLRQAWGSLDALVGRLRAAFEEHGGRPEANPFGARAVRLYLREVRDSQAKARGIAYEKKRRKRPPPSSTSQKAAKATPSPPPPASMHHAAAAAPERQPEVIVARAVPAQGHYFIPHPQHFMHGHFLMPGSGHEDAVAASSSSGNSNSNGHSGGGGPGDEIAMAMAAAAEAHAAGCMLPLSVFN